jgi:hypothetical protein
MMIELYLAQRPGSGDGERKTLLTRQIAFEPLPASVLLNKAAARRGGLGVVMDNETVGVLERMDSHLVADFGSYEQEIIPSKSKVIESILPVIVSVAIAFG